MELDYRPLTPKEKEVFDRLILGESNQEIADFLGIEYGTVKCHVQRIFEKFDVRKREKLMAKVLLGGWADSIIVQDLRRDDSTLTEREEEVLALIAEGKNNQEIGQTLFIEEFTAKTHVSNILKKKGVRSRGKLIAMALQEKGLTHA